MKLTININSSDVEVDVSVEKWMDGVFPLYEIADFELSPEANNEILNLLYDALDEYIEQETIDKYIVNKENL